MPGNADRSVEQLLISMKTPTLLLLWALLPAAVIHGQTCVTPQYLGGFEGEPHDPVRAVPIHGSDGALYFTTWKGGWADDGAIVKVLPDGTRVTLVNFNRLNADRTPKAEPIGYLPETGVIEGPDGALYGTTQSGGNSTIGVSTVFRCTKDGVYITLGYLPGGSAVTPSRLTLGQDGIFYGVTTDGGSGNGTIFRVAPNAPGNYTACTISTITQFSGPAATITATEGRYPRGPLAQRLDGGTYYMYGVVAESGVSPSVTGRVFRFPIPAGPGAISPQSIGRLTGIGTLPEAGLTTGSNGLIYGTVSRNGSGSGGVFVITEARTLVAIHDFGTDGGALGTSPNTPVLYGSDGYLYGGTSGNSGRIWRMDSEGGDAARIHGFSGGVGGNGEDATGLVQRPDGSIWGLTAAGGSDGRGTLFNLSGGGRNWTHNAVWHMGLRATSTEGANPVGGFVSDGSLLYGTTERGGSLDNNGDGYGTIFSYNPATGQKATLFSFRNAAGALGFWPRAALLRLADGWFYGTTSSGGQAPFAGGTVFRWRPAAGINPAQFTTLAQFNGASASGAFPAGAQPESPLLDGGDGWLYGTTTNGGASGFGTLYRVSAAGGTLQTLVQFTGAGGTGKQPVGGLLKFTSQGQTRIWGTTFYGSQSTPDVGTLFAYNPATGVLSTVFDFRTGHAAGYGPAGTLLAHKGLLYGTCKFGGTGGRGTVWTYNPYDGAMSVVRAFDAPNTARHASYPLAGLTVGPDGALYGTTSESYGHFQPGDYGNLYRLSPTNAYSVVGTFTGFQTPLAPALPGANPQQGSLCAGPDGMLYGTTRNGGAGYGGIFRINPGPLVQTLAPRVTSLSTLTATGYINPNGVPCSRSLELISTSELATGGTPISLTRLELPTTATGNYALNFTGLSPNIDYAVRAVAGTSLCGDVFGEWVIVRLTGRSLWFGQQFGANVTNPAIAGEQADPDGDGWSNFHEWMQNKNPLRTDGILPLTVSRSNPVTGFLQATYTYPIARALEGDEFLQLEHSVDMSYWHAFGSYFDAAVQTTPATHTELFFENQGVVRRYFRATAGIKGWERIPTLFNTGVGDNRVTLPDNYVDPHWEAGAIIGGAGQPYGFAYHRNSQFGFPIFPAGPWYGDTATSGWLGYGPSLPGGAGNTYVYRTSFVVPWGVDPRTVAISGRMTSDNETYFVFLNPAGAFGNGNTFITGDGNYSQFGPEFLLTRGFKTGLNTIEFHVADGGAPSGFRAELNGTMGRAGRVAIPGLMNSGCTVIDSAPQTNGQSVPGVRLSTPTSILVTPVVHTSAGGWPVAAGGWFSETYCSAWMKPDSNGSHPAGDYLWERDFDLTGLDLSTVEIRARVASDDGLTILLNGMFPLPAIPVNFTGWTAFELPANLRFGLKPGLNTLVFRVNNAPFAGTNPSGLRYEFLQATAVPLSP
jgi:uncharacterized repeat protein (TIGR03803 family)